jgi:hypothetical protein
VTTPADPSAQALAEALQTAINEIEQAQKTSTGPSYLSHVLVGLIAAIVPYIAHIFDASHVTVGQALAASTAGLISLGIGSAHVAASNNAKPVSLVRKITGKK